MHTAYSRLFICESAGLAYKCCKNIIILVIKAFANGKLHPTM